VVSLECGIIPRRLIGGSVWDLPPDPAPIWALYFAVFRAKPLWKVRHLILFSRRELICDILAVHALVSDGETASSTRLPKPRKL
jgi:hypothetical protein